MFTRKNTKSSQPKFFEEPIIIKKIMKKKSVNYHKQSKKNRIIILEFVQYLAADFQDFKQYILHPNANKQWTIQLCH